MTGNYRFLATVRCIEYLIINEKPWIYNVMTRFSRSNMTFEYKYALGKLLTYILVELAFKSLSYDTRIEYIMIRKNEKIAFH
jgi:hypothetical protein